MFNVKKFCARGCPDPDLSATHYKIDPEKNKSDKEEKAPFDESNHVCIYLSLRIFDLFHIQAKNVPR
jgi:hypothetical protein